MITKYIQGDITETELKYIAHGVNCQNTMGSGVAKALFTKWPEVKENYHVYCNTMIERYQYKPKDFLGWAQLVNTNGPTVFNCFTQENYGYDGKRYVNYTAIVDAFANLISQEAMGVITGPIAIPKIGCGLAGGNWTFMEQLINDTVTDQIEIWVYDNSNIKSSKRNDLA